MDGHHARIALTLCTAIVLAASWVVRMDLHRAAANLNSGDVNCDAETDSMDAELILQFEAGLVNTLACRLQADTDADDNIDSIDAALILQYDAQLVDRLPPLRRFTGTVILARGVEDDCIALQTEQGRFVPFGELKEISVGQRVEIWGFIEPKSFTICGAGPVILVVSVQKLE